MDAERIAELQSLVANANEGVPWREIVTELLGAVERLTAERDEARADAARLRQISEDVIAERTRIADGYEGLKSLRDAAVARAGRAEATVAGVKLLLADLRRAYPEPVPYDTAAVTIDRLSQILAEAGDMKHTHEQKQAAG